MKNHCKAQTILKIIHEKPGIHVRGLMNETGFENGVITHHLQKMEKGGIIKSEKRSRYRRYYPIDISEEQFSIIRNMRKPTKKDVMFEIIVEGTPSFKQIVEKLNKSPSTISWNISELIEEDIIEKCKRNGKNCYRIKDKKRFIETFQKQFKKLFDDKFEHAEDIFLAL